MLEKAIAKLRAEMEKEKDAYTQVIGNFLLQHIEANPAEAEKILAADKTINKSIEAMSNEAKKKAVKGRAMLTDQEGFDIVLKYFGIDGKVQVPVATTAPVEVRKQEAAKKDIDFDVSLDDFV